MPSFRFGGLLLLKDINLPDPAVIEWLNRPLGQNMLVLHEDEGEVAAHRDLWIFATLRKPTSIQLSSALRSRLTTIEVRGPSYTQSDTLDLAFSHVPKLFSFIPEDLLSALKPTLCSLIPKNP